MNFSSLTLRGTPALLAVPIFVLSLNACGSSTTAATQTCQQAVADFQQATSELGYDTSDDRVQNALNICTRPQFRRAFGQLDGSGVPESQHAVEILCQTNDPDGLTQVCSTT